jgi:hypothetical protein
VTDLVDDDGLDEWRERLAACCAACGCRGVVYQPGEPFGTCKVCGTKKAALVLRVLPQPAQQESEAPARDSSGSATYEPPPASTTAAAPPPPPAKKRRARKAASAPETPKPPEAKVEAPRPVAKPVARAAPAQGSLFGEAVTQRSGR